MVSSSPTGDAMRARAVRRIRQLKYQSLLARGLRVGSVYLRSRLARTARVGGRGCAESSMNFGADYYLRNVGPTAGPGGATNFFFRTRKTSYKICLLMLNIISRANTSCVCNCQLSTPVFVSTRKSRD